QGLPGVACRRAGVLAYPGAGLGPAARLSGPAGHHAGTGPGRACVATRTQPWADWRAEKSRVTVLVWLLREHASRLLSGVVTCPLALTRSSKPSAANPSSR